jgi:hypothetical protein
MRFLNMPDEKNIIYCVLVDDSGRIQSTHMMTPSLAKAALEDASEYIDRRKDERDGN